MHGIDGSTGARSMEAISDNRQWFTWRNVSLQAGSGDGKLGKFLHAI